MACPLADERVVHAPVLSTIERESLTTARLVGHAALEKQAEGVVIMDLRLLSSVTDFFVICTAGSARQLNALKEHIETVLLQHGCPVWHTEGTASGALPPSRVDHDPQWVLLDCGEVVVHLLDQPARAFYRLEELWADAPRIPVVPGVLRV